MVKNLREGLKKKKNIIFKQKQLPPLQYLILKQTLSLLKFKKKLISYINAESFWWGIGKSKRQEKSFLLVRCNKETLLSLPHHSLHKFQTC